MGENSMKYVKAVLNILLTILAIWAVCFFGPKILRFFMPFVIGWIIAMIANPLVRLLEKRLKIVRKHSSAVIVVAVLALIVLGGYFGISWLVEEIISFSKDLPELYEQVAHDVSAGMEHFGRLFILLPKELQDSINSLTQTLGEYISGMVQSIGAPTVEVAGNVAKSIPGMLVNVVVTILSSYFFIAERDKLITGFNKYAPERIQKYCGFLANDLKRLVEGYFLAQFRIMLVVAAILSIGFLVLRVNYSVLLAVLIAFLDFLPVFGTGTALIPWAAVKFFGGEVFMGVGLLALYVITQVFRQIIQPKIVGDSMGLSPLLTLFFMFLGFRFKGIAGMILAVPLGMFVMNFYRYGAFDNMMASIRLIADGINDFIQLK